MKRKQVLYFYTNLSSFVKKDIDILSTQYLIATFSFKPPSKPTTIVWFFKQFFFLLTHFTKYDIIVCQFSGYHSFLPSLFSKLSCKPCLIITGGTDCVSFPSIYYGNFSKSILGLFTKWSYRLCTHISPVHETLMLANYSYTNEDFSKQGLLHFIPSLPTPYTTIYNGYDSKVWYKKKDKIKNRFITVTAGIEMPFTPKLKGIDLIIDVAPFFPQCEFVIIGVPEFYNLKEKSKNIIKIPFIDNLKLPDYYSQAEFYLQLSMSEGFPNALSEAMLCECIPIISAVGGMPDIVGNSGYILKHRDTDKLKYLLEQAIACDKNTLAKLARKQIADNYPEQNRKKQLLTLVEKLISR